MKIVVGSRGSKLALTQTEWVIQQLQKEAPDLDFEIKIIKTKGDRIQNVSLDKIGDKGLFVTEIEKELLGNSIDMAIHSMKDMPSSMPEGLVFTPCPTREDPSDSLVTPHAIKDISQLPEGAVIGTGSKRRKYQLLQYRKDLNIAPIRGNIDTRIRKMFQEGMDGIILATAGLNRLNIKGNDDYKVVKIQHDIMLPAPAQGILAIEIKRERHDLYELIGNIAHEETNIQCQLERSFLNAANGSCHIPIGAYCQVGDQTLTLTGLLGKEDGSCIRIKSISGSLEDGDKMGSTLAKEMEEEVNGFER